MSAAEDDLRGQLAAAFKEQRETEAEAPEIVEPEATEQPEAEKPAAERARDEKGRFAPKEAEESAAPEAPEQVAVAEPQQTEPEQERVEPALSPPNGWSAEAKAKWHELPPEIMAAVQKREQDITKFTSTRDEHASFGKEMYQAVQPYLALIKAEGATPAAAVQSMLNTAYVLRNGTPDQKRNALLQTARQFGVDLGAQPGRQPNQPPEIATLYQEIAQLKSYIAQQQQTEQTQLQSEVQAEIEAFAADPKHPHYQAVKGHMAALIAQGAAKDLQDAYDQAVWANAETRATLLAQQRAEEEQKRAAEARRRAEEAKRKSISLTGGPGNTASSAAPGDRSLRDELMANFAAQSGAV